uniref:Uncharacterized protein n=1 Tax=Octopus bimaculoides TaxID=37653 RepID=A0A0L8HER2_OCTBM
MKKRQLHGWSSHFFFFFGSTSTFASFTIFLCKAEYMLDCSSSSSPHPHCWRVINDGK